MDGPLGYLLVYLSVALLAVPAAKRVGLGGVIGYLLAGVVIGPWGLALVRDASHITDFSSLMTLLLLFTIALRSTPARVTRLIDGSVALGLGNMAAVTGLVFLVALAIGLDWKHALICALALALASDGLASEALRIRYPTGSPLSDTGRQLLLTQQLLLVPLVLLLPTLGVDANSGSSVWLGVVTGVVTITLLLLFGKAVVAQAFRFAVGVGLDELFAAMTVLIIVAVLLLFQLLGLPLELGALAAGFLLARSEYGSAINIALRPFRGLIVGLFFVSFGMQIDFGTFLRKPAEVLALVVLLMFVKGWTLRTLLRWSSVPRRQRIWLASLLAQGGELAFVVIALAVGYDAITAKLSTELVLVAALSMLSTPLLLMFIDRRDRDSADRQISRSNAMAPAADTQIIVAGYGRVGRVVAKLLADNGVKVAIIDNNPDRFDEFRRAGFAGFYGDALRPDLLAAAGARRAATLVVAIDHSERAIELVARARREYPQMSIVARAQDKTGRARLLSAGADRAHRETFESALLMGEDALETVGTGLLEAQAMTEAFRDQDEVQS